MILVNKTMLVMLLSLSMTHSKGEGNLPQAKSTQQAEHLALPEHASY